MLADQLQAEFTRRWAMANLLRMEFQRRGFVQRYAENCGTGAGGFKAGNTCAGEGGGGKVNPKVHAWAEKKFKDPAKAKAFSEWFGDSKVVDDDGNPLVVHHGTKGDFSEFKRGTSNAWSDTLGFDTYFHSENKETASTYANQFEDGRVMENYISLKSPLVIDANGGEWHEAIGVASDNIRTYRTPKEKEWLELKSEYEKKYAYELEYEPESIPAEDVDKIENARRELENDILKNKKLYNTSKRQPFGYDGIIVRNVLDMTAAEVSSESGSYNPYTTVYVAFDPAQIKASNNQGTFDPSNPDIRYERCSTT